MQNKIYKQFKKELIEKIKKKFKNHSYKEIYTNIVNNSTNKKIIKLKMIEDERDRLKYVRDLKRKSTKYQIKPEVNDLYKKTIELNKLKRKIYIKFKDSNYKYIDKYIENETNIHIVKFKILKRNIDSIILKIKEIIKNKKEADDKKYKEKFENNKLEEQLKEKERLENYNKNQEKMKTYNKEVLRYDKNSNEARYICSVCKLEDNLSLQWTEQLHVKRGHFKLKLHIDNFNKNISVKVNKSIEGRFINIIFDFKKLLNMSIYEDLNLKKIMKKKVNENKVQNKKYKTTILKIYSESPNIKYSIQEIKTVKITSHDIMNSIDNLEHLENNHLDVRSPEDKLLFKYGKDIVIKDYEKFIKRSDYKKVIKYLKDNDIDETLIYKHISIIYDYLNSNDKTDLETLKKAILSLENSKYSYIELNTLIERPRKSGETISINETREINYNHLRCVIKMTEYIPISGGSISEMNKIPDLFLNKRSLLILRNNDNKCFLYCYIREFLNPITRNRFRITRKDIELAHKIINETNLTFENVSINEMNKIKKN